MAECRSCGALIIWARKPGKPGFMPVDAAPSPKGNVIIGPDGTAEVHAAPVPGGRMAHHATCPHKEHWKAAVRERERR